MRVTVYHEVLPDSLDRVLREGIQRSQRGEKTGGQNQHTDDYLDAHRPADSQLSRQGVVYAYLSIGDKLVDISSGEVVDAHRFASGRDQVLLRVGVDSTDCYVSDLDAYDAVKSALEHHDRDVEGKAKLYWYRVVPLDDYEPDAFHRPELMINADIDGRDIEVV
jgi:hypothetical protein